MNPFKEFEENIANALKAALFAIEGKDQFDWCIDNVKELMLECARQQFEMSLKLHLNLVKLVENIQCDGPSSNFKLDLEAVIQSVVNRLTSTMNLPAKISKCLTHEKNDEQMTTISSLENTGSACSCSSENLFNL
ncbi:uncharacterized protein LOC116338209 [Contarinia nasturtii]|uniref:uncharacterized protein LOC116338209 n=1 Tax=Contarinia nasturtii TaxID=265458 RepID=UPI0012D38847|nr:uncharacterized protein LOC116338209 [Contarinia nasturtii]XP_031619189.1 uncharacterized protein LOC116338209 [Contarinia nasturtii]